jgi:hypothetical protein
METGWNLAELSKEGCGSKRTVLPILMIITIIQVKLFIFMKPKKEQNLISSLLTGAHVCRHYL